MKNLTESMGKIFPYIKKLLLIMRLSVLFILIAVFTSTASVYSQATRLTLKMENARLSEVFDALEKQSEFYFFYNRDYLNDNRIVTVNFENKQVDEILNELFKDEKITYEIFDRNILLGIPESTSNKALLDELQQQTVSGKVIDSFGQPLPGVTVVVKGSTQGTITNADGNYSLNNIPEDAILVFSFIGMRTIDVVIGNQTRIDLQMEEATIDVDEVVVIGYGVQKKSDYTGSVSSIKQEQLEMAPNLSIAQAIQGAMPGVMMHTSSGGTNPTEVIMIRGRNSILASNEPLIILDGIPYGGQLQDIDPNDIKSIEVLKDASAAAVYGSRGANGVILVTSKIGTEGSKPSFSYDGYYSVQSFVNIPKLLTGEEFYQYKMEREPSSITQSEKEIYESKQWVDWLDIALRNGSTIKHNLSVSGGFQNTQYYISGGFTNVKGLALNDNYKRLTSSINLNSEVKKWLILGTRTQLAYDDASGLSPDFNGYRGIFAFNPLVNPYDENGNFAVELWPEEHMANPLMNLHATNVDESYQVVSNNYGIIKIPFLPGLQYRINTGVRVRLTNDATYFGKSTKYGRDQRGVAETSRSIYNNYTVENIIDFNQDFGKHNVFITGLYSYELSKGNSGRLNASGFPHDFLLWYSASQADLITPGFNLEKTVLISQMIRMNYSFDSRFLFTITGRRDGYSGFGSKNKWGIFPSMALGWNMARENFFPLKNLFNELKLRTSYGLNGNQAVRAFETISRLGQKNLVTGTTTLPGYVPSRLGQDNLGWESTKSLNFGIDYALLSNKIVGDFNLYKSNTSDLLLNRTISPVHGITSITQNIGETENRGLEASVTSYNISRSNFKWSTMGNITFNKNKILSLYGDLDEEGNEINDIANSWFIGNPIRVNYGYVWGGVWQLDEKEEAELYGTKPGYVKIKDMNGDTLITTDDRQILGHKDPSFMWGLNNTIAYKSFMLSVFVHGVHGITKELDIMNDQVGAGVTGNTIWKNWWTPENPTNDWYMNTFDASHQNGIYGRIYEKADFIRIKDVSLSYDLAKNILNQIGFSKCQVYLAGRNVITFTNWRGLDPELDGQTDIPLQKEYVLGLNLKF